MTKLTDTEAEQVLLDRLPPRRRSWVLTSLAILGVTVISWALLKLSGHEVLSWLVVVVAVAAIAAVVVFGLRADRRTEILDAFIESTWRRLGWRAPHRSMVKNTSWTGGWVGFPSKLQLRYASSIDDVDPGFSAMVVENAERRFGQSYRVVAPSASFWRPKRAGQLVLAQRVREDSTRDEWEDKTERFVHQLLGSSAKVSTTIEDGAPTEIAVEHSMGAKVAPAGYRQRLERTIFAMVPGRWRAHWDLSAERVRFELRPDLPPMVPHVPQPLPDAVDVYGRYRNFKVAVGVDEDGRHVYWEPIINAHGLVTGGTGKGKTALLHTLTTALCRAGFRVWILDGKRIEFLGFRDWPNVELVASRIEHQVRMLLAAHDEMERRYALIEEGKARLSDFEPLFVIIDEYATFKENATQWYSEVREKSDPTKPAVFARMANIARLGRKAAIHMVVGLQRPDVEFLGGEMRDNFGWRFSLGRLSPQGANMMWESFVIGVTLPTKTRGRGITLDAQGEPVEALALYTPDPGEPLNDSQQAQIDALRPAEATWLRKTFADPDPNLDDENGDAVAVYSDYAQLRLVSFESLQAQRSVQMVEEEAEFIVSRAAADDHHELTAEVDEEDLFAEYGPVDEQRASDLQPGQLVLVDPDLDMWGVVSHEPEPDMTDPELLLIEYLDFETGEEGGISVELSERVQYRIPKEES